MEEKECRCTLCNSHRCFWFYSYIDLAYNESFWCLNILRNQYETKNQTHIQNLVNQLAGEKLHEGEAAESFITRIKNLWYQMTVVGVAMTSEELARQCVWVLPPKYDCLVTALNTQICLLAVTFEDFFAMLLEEEMWLKTWEEDGTAFTTKIRGKTTRRKRNGSQWRDFLGSCYIATTKDMPQRNAESALLMRRTTPWSSHG